MNIKKQIVKNTLIYFFLIVGYLYLYVIDVDTILYPTAEEGVKSKVDFVYQQF